MVKLSNSNFEKIEDIIKALGISFDAEKHRTRELLTQAWGEVVGNKLLRFSKVYEINADNILTIACCDFAAANELYNIEKKILEQMNKKLEKMGIEIRGIKFDYRKWEEQNYE